MIKPSPATIAVALAALARGPLRRDQRRWVYRRRGFNNATVKELVAMGVAVRDRNEVKHV